MSIDLIETHERFLQDIRYLWKYIIGINNAYINENWYKFNMKGSKKRVKCTVE